MPDIENDQRSSIRYYPDRNSLAVIKMDNQEKSELVGLLRDESRDGCAAVFQDKYLNLQKDNNLQIKIDDGDFQEATLIWTKQLDSNFLKAGFEFQ